MEPPRDRCATEWLHPEKVAPLVGKLLRPPEAEQLAQTFALLADPTCSRIFHAQGLADELGVRTLPWW